MHFFGYIFSNLSVVGGGAHTRGQDPDLPGAGEPGQHGADEETGGKRYRRAPGGQLHPAEKQQV